MAFIRLFAVFVAFLLTLLSVDVQASDTCKKCGSTGRCCPEDQLCMDSSSGEHCVAKGEKKFCSDGLSYCYKPTQCCGVMTCCPADSECCGFNTCCPKGAVCCGMNTCCEAGSTCCGLSGCCGKGATCKGGQCYRDSVGAGFKWYYGMAILLPLMVICLALARYRRARRLQALRSGGTIITPGHVMAPPPPPAPENVNPYHYGYDPPSYAEATIAPGTANQNGDHTDVYKDMANVLPPQYSDIVKEDEQAGHTDTTGNATNQVYNESSRS